MKLSVSLYGSIARALGGKYVAQAEIDLEPGACKEDLLRRLGIADEDRGYVFVNAVLYDVPGMTTPSHDLLHDGDHVGIFSVDRIWPYQYRDGIRMSAELKEAMRARGAMHHSYANTNEQTG